MKNIQISLNKTEIFNKVSLNSAYTGAKANGENGFYDRVATIEADNTLLSGFWTEMCGIVTEKLRDLILSTESDRETFSLTLSLSNAYDDALTPSVNEDISNAFSTGICGRWFRFTYPDKASEWLAQSSDCLNRAFSKLYFRKKPTRKG